MREGGAARKWPGLSGRCSCNASDPQCHETQQGYIVEGILNSRKNGDAIRWLTPGKIRWRFFSSVFLKRDIFTPLGL
jgi:hypothetical protein